MTNKFGLIKLAVLASAVLLAAEGSAGTEMVTDNSAPGPSYNYAPQPLAPPPQPVYYAPPPVRVVVYPVARYYLAPVRVYGCHRYRHFWR